MRGLHVKGWAFGVADQHAGQIGACAFISISAVISPDGRANFLFFNHFPAMLLALI